MFARRSASQSVRRTNLFRPTGRILLQALKFGYCSTAPLLYHVACRSRAASKSGDSILTLTGPFGSFASETNSRRFTTDRAQNWLIGARRDSVLFLSGLESREIVV